MFTGYSDEATDIPILFATKEGDAPVDPDAAPTFRVFGQDGAIAGGTGTATAAESGSVTGATNASPIVLASAANGLPTGAYVKVTGVGGNTAANGSFFVTSVDADSFSLDGSTGNGAYTSGGAWKTLGLWRITLTGAVLSALQAGKTYTVHVTWAVGGAARTLTLTFAVQ